MKRIILQLIVVFAAANSLIAAPPEICRVQGGNTRTVWGIGFTPGATEVWGWRAPYDEARVRSAISGKTYSAASFLSTEPPSGSGKMNILDSDPKGCVLTVDFFGHYGGDSWFDAMLGPDVVWVKNQDGFSKPWITRTAKPWWVYPEIAAPGQRVRIFGRNIMAKLIAIKSSSGAPIFFDAPERPYQPMYETAIDLPKDIKPGDYQVYMHNGAGGEAGWGGPINLTVKPAPKPITNVLNVKDFGAKGTGLTDDTAALQLALAKAAKTEPAIVYLPPGRYPINKTLLIRPGVHLKGAGMYNSTIFVAQGRPISFDIKPDKQAVMNGWFEKRLESGYAPLLWMLDNTSLTDLGFEDGPKVMQAAYVGHDNCKIERCRVYMPQATESAILVEWGSYGFTIKDCEIEAVRGGLYVRHGPHDQVYIGGNKFRATKPGLIDTNNIFVRAFNRSIIENNTSSDADRNFVAQAGRASAYHSILKGNSWYNNIPRRHNSGENMYESGSSMWLGKVQKATANTLTVAGNPWVDKGPRTDPDATIYETFVLVLDGRGIGQYRKIISYTPNTLTLEQPWDIIPDETTTITIGRGFIETLWVDNTEEHTANWTGWWGNCWGNVIDGQILRDGEGIYLWDHDAQNPAPVVFNDVIGSVLVGRTQIRMLGAAVFGNTVRATEIIDFRYKPSFHGSMPWMNGLDPTARFAIQIEGGKSTAPGLSWTCKKDWNIIEGMNIYDGPAGIYIAPEAVHNTIRHCQINVDGEKIVDKSASTVKQ
jgi:hypothetical protein